MDAVIQYLDIDSLVTQVVTFAPRIVLAIMVMLAFWLFYRLSRRPLRATLKHTGLHEKLVSLLVDSIYRYTLASFGVVMALSQMGVNVGAAVAGLGVAGIAVGLAAQDALSNTIAGFTIFWDKPFVVGDWISVSGQYGEVRDITLRSTRIRTPRNSYIVIPNKRIIDEVLENDSKHGRLRLDLPLGIAYKEDTEAAREVLLAAIRNVEGVLQAPAPDVVVDACADSSVNLLLRVWIEDAADRQRTRVTVLEAGKRALDAAGIQIPYPHLQVFWDDVDAQVVDKLSALRGGGSAA